MRNFITESVNNMIADAINLDLIKGHEEFTRRLQLKVKPASGCWGGLNRQRSPVITLSTHMRYTDKEAWLANQIASGLWKGKKQVWVTLYEHALRGEWYHTEYSHFNNDPEIGAFVSDDPYDHLLCTTAHELAHAIQYWNWDHTYGARRPIPHGREFQNIYRELRVNIVNPIMYGEPETLAAETED